MALMTNVTSNYEENYRFDGPTLRSSASALCIVTVVMLLPALTMKWSAIIDPNVILAAGVILMALFVFNVGSPVDQEPGRGSGVA